MSEQSDRVVAHKKLSKTLHFSVRIVLSTSILRGALRPVGESAFSPRHQDISV